MSKHKMILLTTKSTKEKLEGVWRSQKKQGDDDFIYLARLEGEVVRSINRNSKPGRTEIII